MSKSNPSGHPVKTTSKNLKGEWLKSIYNKTKVYANESLAARTAMGGHLNKKRGS